MRVWACIQWVKASRLQRGSEMKPVHWRHHRGMTQGWQVRVGDEVGGERGATGPSILPQLSATGKTHRNDFQYFPKLNMNFKSLFLFPLTAAFHSAAGQGLTRGGGRRFSPDLRVQTLVRSPALPTSSRRFLLGRDADRILRGFFPEWTDWECLRRCFKHRLACVVEIYHLN